ncbi:MAG: hypothetical protein ACRD2A_04285, partial [Vicinamibacterales bacterium]
MLRDEARARLSLTRIAGSGPDSLTSIALDDPHLRFLRRHDRSVRIPATKTWHDWIQAGIELALPLIENDRWIGLI